MTGYASRFKNVTSAFIAKHLHFDSGRNQWGVNVDTGGINVFHECYIDPAMPTQLTDVVRSCSGKATIVDCPESFGDQATVELCHSYTALIFEPNTAYRNIHCAICNNADLEKLICLNLGPFGRFNWQQNFNTFSFAVLFDLGGNLNESVGHVKACNDGQMFDPFFAKCRKVSCGSSDKIYRQGKCLDAFALQEFEATTTTSTTPTTTSTLESSGSKISFPIAFPSVITTITTTTTTTTTTSASISASTSETTFAPTLLEESTLVSTEAETTSEVEPEEVTESVTLQEDEIVFDTSTSTTPETTTTTSTSTPDPKSNQHHKEAFVDCPKFELQVGEFQMMNSSVAYIKKYDKTVDSDNFEIDNEVLIICASLADATDEVAKFSSSMSIVTIVCLGISLICLSLHVFATFFSPDLQNLSGKNLFSLSLALIGSYSSFIAAMFRGRDDLDNLEDSGCFALAVIMYFFFMASFFWMLVIAFDVCRTLRVR